MVVQRFKIAVDPGHGGRDPGAVGPTGLKEKDVTLAVSKRVAFYLAPVADVVLTRSDDRDYGPAGKYDAGIDIGHRARQIVNKSGANVCISIHCNSSGPTAHGVETYRHHYKPQDERLARAVQAKLVAATGRADRGVKVANFGMIRIPVMPSCLVELPFISNPTEERLLGDPSFQDRCARAIVEGVSEFLGVKLPSKEELAMAIFKDVVNHWAKGDIEWLAERGLVAKAENFRPDDKITRAETAVLIRRAIEYTIKEVTK